MESSNGLANAATKIETSFSERLWPSIKPLLFGQLIFGSVGIAYAYPYTSQAGFLVWLGLTVCGALLAIINSPKIEVTNRLLRAGKAQLPLHLVGEVKVLDQIQTRTAVKSATQSPGYLVVRPGIKQSIVFVNLDTEDPHPYWLISTRASTSLVTALLEAKQKAKATG